VRKFAAVVALGFLFVGGAYAATTVTELHVWTATITQSAKGKQSFLTISGTVTDQDTYPDPVTVTQTVTESVTTEPPTTTAPSPTTTTVPTTTTTPPPPTAASVYLSATGSDANPCTQAAPCRTFQRGYNVATPGSTVSVACGAYGGQPVQRNGKPQPTPIAFVSATPRCAKTGGIFLGADTGSESGNAPAITLDGLDIEGTVNCMWTGGGPLRNITVQNSWLHDVTNSFGDALQCGDSEDLTSKGNEYGPYCCQTNPIGIGLSNVGAPPNRRHLYENDYIHDIVDSCRYLPNVGCAGRGYGDEGDCCGARHIDGMQFIDLHDSTIRNVRTERVGGASGQGIFFASNNGGTYSNILIEGSNIGPTPQTEFSVSGPGVGILSGFLTIRNTVIAGDLLLYDRTPRPGTVINIDGVTAQKAGGYKGESQVYCTVLASDGSTLPINWSNTTGDPGCDSTNFSIFTLSFLR
jgi:hypothetical protein